ncbi:MAG: enoyl-CoA hydratase/isomerase family protein [Planctomycetes bacterium]|nr:enoyl-CoA hydratase/isomerase family protein [Planctomycetota bacterium]
MPDLVLLDASNDDTAILTFNRPEARNPTSIALLDGIDRALDELGDRTRVLILRGAGRSFCSGLDLAEVRADEATIRTLLRRLSEVMRRIRRLPAVTIAQVQGAAIGGGFGFLAASDFAITHPESKVGYPPLKTCLSPALMAPWLFRKIGASRARAMLLTGGTISGSEAHAAGIVTHLVALDELDDAADELAGHLCEGGRYAMSAMKDFLNELDDSLSDAMLDRAQHVSADVIACGETQEKLRELFGA